MVEVFILVLMDFFIFQPETAVAVATQTTMDKTKIHF